MVDNALAARLAQLNQAKSLVEADASYFPQIVVGVLPVFSDPAVELRRWASDFVLLAFSSRKLPLEDKEDLALKCLEKLAKSIPTEKDVTTAKGFIQISTIIYPLVFRHMYATEALPGKTAYFIVHITLKVLCNGINCQHLRLRWLHSGTRQKRV